MLLKQAQVLMSPLHRWIGSSLKHVALFTASSARAAAHKPVSVMSYRPHHPAFPESKWSLKSKTRDKLRYRPCPCCKSADSGMQVQYPVAITNKFLDRCNAVQSPDPDVHLGMMPRAIMLHIYRSSLRCSWPQLCQIYFRCITSRSVLSSSTPQTARHALCTNLSQ